MAISLFKTKHEAPPEPEISTEEPIFSITLPQREEERPREDVGGEIVMLPTDKIRPNPAQPRKEFNTGAIMSLADSIKRYGVLQPLSVRQIDLGDERIYELIAGERRLRASQVIGLERVPCVIVEADEQTSAELAIIENLQREDLNIFEQAGAIATLIDIYSMTQEQIAERLSVSQSYVANKLRLLRLSALEKDIILEEHLTERHARALLRIPEPEMRLMILRRIAERGLNVAASEEYIDSILLELKAKKEGAAKRNPSGAGSIKDIRLFYNSIDRAIDIMRRSGIGVISEKRDCDDTVELTIRIPKKQIAHIKGGVSLATSAKQD